MQEHPLTATIQFSKSIVYFGEKYVELNDGEATLNDLCEAFEVPYELGTNLKDRGTGSIVATLPSDIVAATSHPSTSGSHGQQKATGSEVAKVDEFFPQTEENIDGKDESVSVGENEEGQGANEASVRLLELCVPSCVGKVSDAGRQDGGQHVSSVVNSVGEASNKDALSAAYASGTNPTELVDEVFQELVRLGAVELLFPELPQRLAHLPPYDPQDNPGLLGRIIYPPSVYSPYRSKRDPLAPHPATSNSNHHFLTGLKTPFGVGDSISDSTWKYRKDGAPYSSALDTYETMDCEADMKDFILASCPDLVPFKDGDVQVIYHKYD